MRDELKQYRAVPVGEQLGVHFKQRAKLRREIPLFSFSLSSIVKRFEADTGKCGKRDGDLQHI